jgi:hypothetical protein
MWDWYEWQTLEDFNQWHNSIKTQLGLPKQSININGDACNPIIENYTEAVIMENNVIAMVENEYAENLTITQLRPIKITRNAD